MRSEEEMMALILGIAQEDARIRAVYLNGSRANPDIPRDCYQDYDVVYVVTETESFRADAHWISRFGDPMIVQMPDALDAGLGQPVNLTRSFGWLMLFSDGVRIDLHIETPDCLDAYGTDTLTVSLLDKDGLLPALPPASDRSHWVRPPSAGEYAACCSDFWWCLNNVAKGILRDQLPYVMRMYHTVIHPRLDDLALWCAASRVAFSRTFGMWGKYLRQGLHDDEWSLYAASFAGGSYDELWSSIDAACTLFARLSQELAQKLGYPHIQADEVGMQAYLQEMRSRFE